MGTKEIVALAALLVGAGLMLVACGSSDTSASERRAAAGGPTRSACDPNYSGACLNPNASDYDCEGGSGNGPYYTGEVTVVGEDHYGLDGDGDGIGCEAY